MIRCLMATPPPTVAPLQGELYFVPYISFSYLSFTIVTHTHNRHITILSSPSHYQYPHKNITPVLLLLTLTLVRFDRSSCPDGRATMPTKRPPLQSRKRAHPSASSKTLGSDRNRAGVIVLGGFQQLTTLLNLPQTSPQTLPPSSFYDCP